MLDKASWYSIDVSANDGHILLFYEKFHFCHLLPFAKLGQSSTRGGRIHGKDLLEILVQNTSFLCI